MRIQRTCRLSYSSDTSYTLFETSALYGNQVRKNTDKLGSHAESK